MDQDSKYYAQLREDVAFFVPSPEGKSILDVGCGQGMFGKLLLTRLNAREVWGIEPQIGPAKIAESNLQRVIVGQLQTCSEELPEKYFDMIFFNDSLEHMEDPWAALEAIREKLTPTGIVCASIPNVRWYRNVFNLLIRKDWEYVEEGILDRTHLRFFTKKSMARLFESSGYKVQKLQGLKYSGGKFWIFFKILNIFTLFFFEDCFYKNYLIIASAK